MNPEGTPVDYRDRTRLALSVISHREWTPELVGLVQLILEGAGVQDCYDLTRLDKVVTG